MASISMEDVQPVLVFPTWEPLVHQYELVAGEIIRCKKGPKVVDVRSSPWTAKDADMVRHLLSLPHEHAEVLIASWEGQKVAAVTYPSSRRWVIRREDGTVYQTHPFYATSFAQERFAELARREGG
jgi:hypothetical protein